MLCPWVERDGATQVFLRFLKASQPTEHQTEDGMCLSVVWALFYRDAVRGDGILIHLLITQCHA